MMEAVTRLTWNLSSDLQQLFAFHFMVNAFRAGTVVAVVAAAVGGSSCCGGPALPATPWRWSHSRARPGPLAGVISVTVGYFAASIAAALVIAMVPPASRGRTSRESAVIGTVQAFALACGVLFVSLYGGLLDSVTGLLFGSFLGIADSQVVTLLIVGVAVLAVLAAIARPLFFASVDPDVASARGVPVRLLGVVFLVLLGTTAAEVSQITGALLVFALLVMPAAAAQQLTARPVWSLVLAVLLALAVTWAGLAAAYFSSYPVGFYVTTFGFAAYGLAAGGRAVAEWIGTRGRPQPAPRLAVEP